MKKLMTPVFCALTLVAGMAQAKADAQREPRREQKREGRPAEGIRE